MVPPQIIVGADVRLQQIVVGRLGGSAHGSVSSITSPQAPSLQAPGACQAPCWQPAVGCHPPGAQGFQASHVNSSGALTANTISVGAHGWIVTDMPADQASNTMPEAACSMWSRRKVAACAPNS